MMAISLQPARPKLPKVQYTTVETITSSAKYWISAVPPVNMELMATPASTMVTEADPKANTYHILIRHGNGRVNEYSLSESFLTDHATLQTFPITADTYCAFMDILNLPFH